MLRSAQKNKKVPRILFENFVINIYNKLKVEKLYLKLALIKEIFYKIKRDNRRFFRLQSGKIIAATRKFIELVFWNLYFV